MRTSLLFLLLFFYALPSLAQSDGSLDNTFGTNGVVTTTVMPAQRNTVHKLLEQPDGKIIAIGTTNEYSSNGNVALARYNSNGSLDISFGTGGIVTYNAGGWSGGTSGLLLTNGKIVVAGFKNQGIPGSRAIVLRFNSNGTIDNTYDGDGVMEIGPATGTQNAFLDIEKDVSGSYYLSGNLDNGSGNTDIAVVKLTAALSVDNSFGVLGITQIPTDAGADNYGYAISIQSDGKIVGGGMTQQGGGQKGLLFRLLTNGSLDMSFAGTGWFHDATLNSFNDIGIQSTGRIVTVAFRYSFGAYLCTRIYESDGTLVPASIQDITNRIGFSLVVQPDDRFLIAGTDGGSSIFSLARFDTQGVPEDLDPTPASLNDAQTDITAVNDYSLTVLLQSDGKYLIAGLSGVVGSPGVYQFTLVRYLGLSGAIGLPVGLIHFVTAQQGQQVNLSWSTGFEQNNKGFEIERSANGRDFIKIGWVAGKGNSNNENSYAFTDASPVNGKNYYRLKQIDIDGNYEFSEIRSLVFTGKHEFTISPNPVIDKLTLRFENTASRKITVTDMQGRVCWLQQNGSDALISIPLNQLHKGIYTIQVIDNDGKIQVQKFMKE